MKQLDEQYHSLRNRWDRIGAPGPFEEAIARTKLRSEMDELAAGYLALFDTTDATQAVGRLLALFEMFRSPEVSMQSFRMAAIGKRERAKWPLPVSNIQANAKSGIQTADTNSVPAAPRRICLATEIFGTKYPPRKAQYEMEEIEIWNSSSYAQRPLSYENVVLIHCGFVGDDLVTVLDTSFLEFAYGRDAIFNKRVQSKWFSDFGYDPTKLNIEAGFYPPIVRKGARPKLLECATRIHAAFHEESHPRLLQSLFDQQLKQLDELFSFSEIEAQLKFFAGSRRIEVNNVCVAWLPFDFLFRLPLAFLGHSFGRPLVQITGGVSCSISLAATKYSIMKHHWMSGRDFSREAPRCVLFSADPTGELNLEEEIRIVGRQFLAQNCAVFRNASSSEFALFSNAGDVLWFCGHGSAKRQRIDLTDNFQFLLSGPQFADKMVSNLELISTGQHNFESVWLMVMNCCTLGESELIGSNPIGFMTATYAAGAIGCISNLWPVRDDAALDVADKLATSIQENFPRNDFPRARALNIALRNCIEPNPRESWRFGSYALWGLP
jgi:CHAT domain-containing protein